MVWWLFVKTFQIITARERSPTSPIEQAISRSAQKLTSFQHNLQFWSKNLINWEKQQTEDKIFAVIYTPLVNNVIDSKTEDDIC